MSWSATHAVCPNCGQIIVWLSAQDARNGTTVTATLVWPMSSERPVAVEVPATIAQDFVEACRVLSISPQASAALTRRCLQQVLREYGGTKSKDLYEQIQEVTNEGLVPPALAQQLDAVRVIGNFAAHPLKSTTSGAILPVEDHEAEWNVDVLESVFDHYFVKPAQAKARKDLLNKKLSEAGKPLLP